MPAGAGPAPIRPLPWPTGAPSVESDTARWRRSRAPGRSRPVPRCVCSTAVRMWSVAGPSGRPIALGLRADGSGHLRIGRTPGAGVLAAIPDEGAGRGAAARGRRGRHRGAAGEPGPARGGVGGSPGGGHRAGGGPAPAPARHREGRGDGARGGTGGGHHRRRGEAPTAAAREAPTAAAREAPASTWRSGPARCSAR